MLRSAAEIGFFIVDTRACGTKMLRFAGRYNRSAAPIINFTPVFGSVALEEAIQKADVLLEALQWIRQFRGKITVIKLGGGAS